jgi:iron complex outermembrane recepter protein
MKKIVCSWLVFAAALACDPSWANDDDTESAGQPIASANAESDNNKQRLRVLEEVIITAQKRQERLQDVPVPAVAISADSLMDNNQLRLQDYYASVPGLNFTTGNRGEPLLAIRGITSGAYTNPTIGITVDDVPYGSSTSLGGGAVALDMDPSDLARIEVLRGPQGTLYGASSMGGLLKYVTVDPSTSSVNGRLQGSFSDVQNGSEQGYSLRGSINVPLGDTWAMRASGFTRRDPGYIDDPSRDVDGVNRIDADGGRLSALWLPSEDFSVKLSALYQDSKRYGSSAVHLQPGLRDLQQSALRGTGAYRGKSRVYSATLAAKFGDVDLTSLSGYSINSWTSTLDLSPFFLIPLIEPEDNETKKFTQEIRLSAPIGQKFEWLLGAFYTEEKTDWLQTFLFIDPATGIPASWGTYVFGPTKYEEYSAFANLTFHVSDRFDLQIGGRESRNRQAHAESATPGVLFGPGFSNPTERTEDNAFTYLVTPRFKISPDVMMYARFASGYRAGGPNFLSALTGARPQFSPDKTKNYEVGVKGDVFGEALSLDASLYYIDWEDLQLLVQNPGDNFSQYTNASRAKSEGVELSVESRPLTGLTIAAWVAWTKAVLTEALPPGPAFGRSGDKLPYSSPFSGNLSLEQEFPLANSMTGFAGTSVSYVDDRVGGFKANALAPQIVYPSYVQVDLRAGVRYDSWTLNVFLNNVADKRGILTGDPAIATTVYYIQPRTAGLSVSKTF